MKNDKPLPESGNQWYWAVFACAAWFALSTLSIFAWLL